MNNMEFLELVSAQLGTLKNVIETMNMGLIAEGMEEQAVDCMECLGNYVNSIKEMIDKHIKENE